MTAPFSGDDCPGANAVLVVDDDQDIRETMQEVLQDDGFSVATARNGEKALTWLRASPAPALILLDLSMPVMNGEAFRQEQRNDPLLALIPVIVLSAAAGLADKVRRMQIDGCLRKPVDLNLLLLTVGRYCARQSDQVAALPV
jgi:CheY-like chemotaxis protein